MSPDSGPLPRAEAPPERTEAPLDAAAVPLGWRPLPVMTGVQTGILAAILVLLVLFALYAAGEVIAPLAVAVLLNLMLSPAVHRLRRLGLPNPLGAALMLVLLLGTIGWGGYALSGPAVDWLDKAPQNLAELELKIRALLAPVEGMQRATEQVDQITGNDGAGPRVTISEQSWGEWVVTGTANVVVQVLIIVVLSFFLLASGDVFMRRLVRAFSTSQDKRRVVEIVHAVQRDVSAYLATVTMINAGLGIATGLAMWGVGMPNPVLWGVMAGVLNYLPYVGAMTTIAVLALVGLLSFDDPLRALAAPGAFFVLTNIEANFITPVTLGGRLTLNPALVFISLVVWSWLWGVPGAILAVPLLVTLKAFADHITSWHGLSTFLGRED